MSIVNLNPMRTELLNIHTYLKYLLETIDHLLNETPAEQHMYQTAWLSKCLNLEEILIIFQNQFINKREQFNLVLDKTLKELNADIGTNLSTDRAKVQTINNKTQNNLNEMVDVNHAAIINYTNAVNNELTTLKQDLQKKFELIDAAIINFDEGISVINNLLQEIFNKEQILTKQIEKENISNPSKKSWVHHVDEINQKMKERGWSEHEVCERAKINFNSFRKFQKKDPKVSNIVVNKILQLFDILR